MTITRENIPATGQASKKARMVRYSWTRDIYKKQLRPREVDVPKSTASTSISFGLNNHGNQNLMYFANEG